MVVYASQPAIPLANRCCINITTMRITLLETKLANPSLDSISSLAWPPMLIHMSNPAPLVSQTNPAPSLPLDIFTRYRFRMNGSQISLWISWVPSLCPKATT